MHSFIILNTDCTKDCCLRFTVFCGVIFVLLYLAKMAVLKVFHTDPNFMSWNDVTLIICNSKHSCHISSVTVHYKVKCLEDTMLVDLVRTESTSDIYLEQLKYFPGK